MQNYNISQSLPIWDDCKAAGSWQKITGEIYYNSIDFSGLKCYSVCILLIRGDFYENEKDYLRSSGASCVL